MIFALLGIAMVGYAVFRVGVGYPKSRYQSLTRADAAFVARAAGTDHTQDAIDRLPHFIGAARPLSERGRGLSAAALRRTARFGDTWFPIGNNPRHPLDTVERFARGCANMRAVAEKHDRNPQSIGLAFFANWFDESKTMNTPDGQRLLLTGNSEQIAEDIHGLERLGVRDLILNFQRDTLEQSLDSMQHFAEKIRPLAN